MRATRNPAAGPERRPPLAPLAVILAAYLLTTAAIYAEMYLSAHHATPQFTGEPVPREVYAELIWFDAVDTVFVLSLVLFLAPGTAVPPTRVPRRVAWALAPFGLIVLLAVNFAYGHTLKSLVEDLLQRPLPDPEELLTWDNLEYSIPLVCLQPAVVEELFFRRLMLGHLRPHVGVHGAVWLTAVLFGLAHAGRFAQWPVLALLGAGLGYARVYSGGLWLPMVLHFAHNFAVLYVQAHWVAALEG